MTATGTKPVSLSAHSRKTRSGLSGAGYLGAATGLVAGAYGMCRFGFGLTLPRVTETLGLTGTFAGTAAAAAFATYCLAALATGALVNRGHLTFTAVCAAVTALAGSLLVATATGAAWLLGGVALAGAAAGFVSPTVATGLRRIAPTDREPRWQALANAGTGFGVLAAGILAFWVPWRGSWVIYGALTATAAVTLLILYKSATGGHRTSAAEPASSTTTETRGSVSALIVPVVLAIAMGFGSAVFWTFGRTQAESSAHLTQEQSLAFWCAVGGSGIVGALAGDATIRFGFRVTWSVTSLLLAGSIAATTLVSNVAAFTAIGLIFGATYVILCGTQITAAAIAWPRAVGTGTAITFTAIAAGQITGSIILGKLLDSAGPTVAFLTGAAVCAASALLIHTTRFARPEKAHRRHLTVAQS